MPEEHHLLKPKLALAKLRIQLILTQQLQRSPQVLLLLLPEPRVYQYIINEHHNKLVEVWNKDLVHLSHEKCWSISQSKQHDWKLILSISHAECGLLNILIPDSKLMVAWSRIYLKEVSCTLKLIKELVNLLKKILVLDGDLIQLAVVDAHPHGTILFLYKQHWCAPRWHARPNESFVQQHLQLCI